MMATTAPEAFMLTAAPVNGMIAVDVAPAAAVLLSLAIVLGADPCDPVGVAATGLGEPAARPTDGAAVAPAAAV